MFPNPVAKGLQKRRLARAGAAGTRSQESCLDGREELGIFCSASHTSGVGCLWEGPVSDPGERIGLLTLPLSGVAVGVTLDKSRCLLEL